jgi:flagellar hook-associated protein 3 FlgL
MRISTSQLYRSGVLGMERNQSQLVKLQNQISSGRRILTPADDPVASARALGITQARDVAAQYGRNQTDASDRLSLVDTQLNSLTDLLQNVRSRVVQAGNTILADSDRQAIAAEMEARFDEMLGIANSRSAEGDYLFAGYQGGTQPFVRGPAVSSASTSSVTYFGDDGQRLLQVSASRQMAINFAGSDLFMNIREGNGSSSTNKSAFQTMQEVIDLLRRPLASSSDRTAYSGELQGHLSNLDQTLNNFSRVQSTVGGRLQELDALANSASAIDIQYQQTLSDLQELDYAQALSDFTRQKVSLEAAQKSFVAISGLSLFDYL